MNSPLASAMLRRKKATIINAGLQVQARVDRGALGIDDETAEVFENAAEREFSLWADSLTCDYDGRHYFGEMQGLTLLNVFYSGDIFFTLPYVEPTGGNPYGTCVKLIDADLVRDPRGVEPGKDIQGGVEKDKRGRPVAVHVWNCYEYDSTRPGGVGESTRIPIYNSDGVQQVFHVADFERIGQRRGVPLLAPAVEPLKQLTRLSEAQLMNALVSAYFTVFVKDLSGMGTTLGPAFTPEQSLFQAGHYGPNSEQTGTIADADKNDLEMGVGNINYLDQNTDVTMADPRKVDTGFQAFWEALGNQVTAVGGIPFEQAMIKYTTSYTAARAALLDGWRETQDKRAMISRRFCSICYQAVIDEAVTRGRLQAPGYFSDPLYRKAWTGSYWVGVGMGSIDPLKDVKATQFNLATLTTTYEEEYMERKGGRWDEAMNKRAREKKLLARLDLKQEAVNENGTVSSSGSTNDSGSDEADNED